MASLRFSQLRAMEQGRQYRPYPDFDMPQSWQNLIRAFGLAALVARILSFVSSLCERPNMTLPDPRRCEERRALVSADAVFPRCARRFFSFASSVCRLPLVALPTLSFHSLVRGAPGLPRKCCLIFSRVSSLCVQRVTSTGVMVFIISQPSRRCCSNTSASRFRNSRSFSEKSRHMISMISNSMASMPYVFATC